MKRKSLLLVGIILFLGYYFTSTVLAEQCDPNCSGIEECRKKIAECQHLLDLSVDATKPHEEEAVQLQTNIAALASNVKSLSGQIDQKKADITVNEKRLADRQASMDAQVRDFYKQDYSSNLEYMLYLIFSGSGLDEKLRALAYRQSVINVEKRGITSLAVELSDLATAKKDLEDNQAWLEQKKTSLEKTLIPVQKLIADAKSYQSNLSATVGSLSAKQQQFLAERTGNFQTSVGDVPLADDPNSSIDGFRNNAPAGSFAVFSFGSPHFKGMSQYGAWGRAKEGQSAEQILKAYFGSGVEIKKDYRTDITIRVDGYDAVDLETYVKRIYEMPTSWADSGGLEALKAQAVAARSYVLARTNDGQNSICASESCQVYKPMNKGVKWDEVVDNTRGWVVMANGQPLSTLYSITSGGFMDPYTYNGYTAGGFWDTKCGNQSCWTGDAFEKIAGSPWFYKAWYKDRGGRNCGRGNPWLSQDEFADLVNATIVYSSGGDTSGIFPEDINSCFGRSESPWSKDRMKQEAGNHGGAVNSVSSISVTYSTNGVTNNVAFETNRGTVSFSGSQFRTAFNLRAPSKLYLPSGLFNIEKK